MAGVRRTRSTRNTISYRTQSPNLGDWPNTLNCRGLMKDALKASMYKQGNHLKPFYLEGTWVKSKPACLSDYRNLPSLHSLSKTITEISQHISQTSCRMVWDSAQEKLMG